MGWARCHWLNAAARQPVPRPEAMQTPPRSGFQLPAVAVPELQFAHRGDAFSALPRLPALERAVAQYRQVRCFSEVSAKPCPVVCFSLLWDPKHAIPCHFKCSN